MKLNRAAVERAIEGAQMRPVSKQRVGDYEVYIADGYSAQPHLTYKRFGAEPGEFSFGAYCTIWFVARDEDFFEVGAPALYEAFHNPELETGAKQMSRVNTAMKDARAFIKNRKRIVSERISLNA